MNPLNFRVMKKKIGWSLLFIVLLIGALISYLFKFRYDVSRVSTGRQIEKTATPKAALLVIDIQECTTGKTSNFKSYKLASDSLIKTVNSIIRLSVCNNIPVVYIRNEVSDYLINLLDDSMEKGSEGTEIDHRLLVVSDHIFKKEKQDAFSNPELDQFMIKNKVNELYITGLDAANCVNSTILAARNRGYLIRVIDEGIIADKKETKEKMIKEFAQNGITILSLAEFQEKLANCP